jgi:hypothetical protein
VAAQRALEQEIDEVTDWRIRPLSGGWETTTSIYQVAGRARRGEQAVDWTLILKIVRATADRIDPIHWNYWKREPLAYRSGLLDDMPGGIAAPRCYGVIERSDETIWIWLEELKDMAGSDWPLTAYRIAARQLGHFNGAYLAGWPLPAGDWVSQGWLRSYVEDYAPIIEQLPALQANLLVARAIPPRFRDDLLRLCLERHIFLEALDRLPQTFCHLDAWRWNLFLTAGADGQSQVAAVDWAFAGLGAVGQELAPLVFSNLADPGLEAYALDGYLEGLAAAGWQGETWTVRLGYLATTALEYGLAVVGFYLAALVDEAQHEMLEQSFGEPVGRLVEHYASWLEFALPRAEQARPLLEKLP